MIPSDLLVPILCLLLHEFYAPRNYTNLANQLTSPRLRKRLTERLVGAIGRQPHLLLVELLKPLLFNLQSLNLLLQLLFLKVRLFELAL